MMSSQTKKKEKYYNQNIFNKYKALFANICKFNFGLNFFMSRASWILEQNSDLHLCIIIKVFSLNQLLEHFHMIKYDL